jgi:hypothetical protein
MKKYERLGWREHGAGYYNDLSDGVAATNNETTLTIHRQSPFKRGRLSPWSPWLVGR